VACPKCGEIVDAGENVDITNYTSNVSGIWEFALGCPMRDLDGRTGRDCIPILESAIARANAPESQAMLRSMEPSNGWGDLYGAREVLDRLLAACREWPAGRVRISS
jgi:hypothetical protein